MGWAWSYGYANVVVPNVCRRKMRRGASEHNWDDKLARHATCLDCGAVRTRVRV